MRFSQLTNNLGLSRIGDLDQMSSLPSNGVRVESDLQQPPSLKAVRSTCLSNQILAGRVGAKRRKDIAASP